MLLRILRRPALLAGGLFPAVLSAASIGYLQTNLVSDGTVPAAMTDSDLKNPWGISYGASTPFWVSDNGTGKATLYEGSGAKRGLVVGIPPAPGSPAGTISAPTGTVFNGNTSDFMGDRFLFATEDGTIAGWQPSLGTTAAIRADNSSAGAEYKGLAILGGRIYATDFAHGRVDIWDMSYNPVTISGAFTDPNLPSGYAPFGIQALDGSVLVTFAKQGPGGDDEAGPGFGFVDKFDANGSNLQRLIVGDPGNPASPLNSPWGMALAPAGFGIMGGKLLVGNFGNGRINAFDPVTGAFAGPLKDAGGNPIGIDGLWGLAFGNSGPGFNPNRLYFTAGVNDEAGGLFGSLQAVPEPGTFALIGLAFPVLFTLRGAGRVSNR